ncbi:M48 family metalloprotease [Moritella sp. Urea-trap-13]|uniref:beta-barrel assembly-enhancing protease n=1 Tax=Moritella sp. Urea-trap-13 TaxID=2058327 RepID=UPI001E3F3614|nr:M48 family metalloprotease [Moritella sp. Urea-trap-13]
MYLKRMYLKKILRVTSTALFVGALGLISSVQATNKLPEIGTAGVTALSIDQERQYGAAFIKVARGSFPMVSDPVLQEYIAELGAKLISQTDSVRFPFNFFLIKDDEINAAAFLGGYVKVHTGLFLYAENESEFASVIAHEISHITQRHLARSLEAQAGNSQLTVAGLVGAVLLGIANPVAGIAMLQTTVAINAQSAINYTRANEFEADRIGIQVMANAGFDPAAMSTFFGKLAEQYRFSSTPPQMLITHPLPTTRVTEARDRAALYPSRYYQPSLDYQLAKARIQVRYGTLKPQEALQFFEHQLKTKKFILKDAALYGQALALIQLGKNAEAKNIVVALASKQPNNLFYLDTLTDIDLALKHNDEAIARLQKANNRYTNNPVTTINLAVALQQAKKYDQAKKLIRDYLRSNETDMIALSIYIDLLRQTDDNVKMYVQRANLAQLKANYPRALNELQSARTLATGSADIARIDAHMEQIEAEKLEMQALQN